VAELKRWAKNMFNLPASICYLAVLAIGGQLMARKRGKGVHWAAGVSLVAGIFHPVTVIFVAHALSLTARHVGSFVESSAVFLPYDLGALWLGIYSWRKIKKEPERYSGRAAAVFSILICAGWTLCGILFPLGVLLWMLTAHSGGG
jgi:hypothetical protein